MPAELASYEHWLGRCLPPTMHPIVNMKAWSVTFATALGLGGCGGIVAGAGDDDGAPGAGDGSGTGGGGEPTRVERVPGRPFIVAGQAVVAQTARRRDWACLDFVSPSPRDRDLQESVRERAAAYWTKAGLLEHASIAAFARFALQLLALGAPVDLVHGAQAAMADEIEHARLCFGLAWRYRGCSVGPDALPVTDCMSPTDLETVVRMVVREGCIGETVAAVLAAEAFGHARDRKVKKVLRRISADETRHAELAWRFLRWALGQDAQVAHAAVTELIAAEQNAVALPSGGPNLDSISLSAHGVLPEVHAKMLEFRTINEVVRPLLDQMLKEAETRLVA